MFPFFYSFAGRICAFKLKRPLDHWWFTKNVNEMENERRREREGEQKREKKISENVRVCLRIRESFPLFYLDSYAQIVRFDNSLDGKFTIRKSLLFILM